MSETSLKLAHRNTVGVDNGLRKIISFQCHYLWSGEARSGVDGGRVIAASGDWEWRD